MQTKDISQSKIIKDYRERVRYRAESFVAESNKIEGILTVTARQVREYIRFVELDEVTVADLQMFVVVNETTARLRLESGMDVIVGNHQPLPGGQHILYRIDDILSHINSGIYTPYENHVEYEALHPFSDCNGRSGRALWAWQMRNEGHYWMLNLGFLHAFYYQSLQVKQP